MASAMGTLFAFKTKLCPLVSGGPTIFRSATSARLVKHADASYPSFRRPTAVKCALVYGFLVRIDSELHHAKGHGSAHKDIAAAI